MKKLVGLFVALGLVLGPLGASVAQVPPTQCITNARAGGTVNAITIPYLPCGFATNMLILTLAGTNSSSTVTLQMAGFPAQPVLRSDRTALQIGDLPGANAEVLLTSTGSSWLLFNTSTTLSGIQPVANGGTGNSTLTLNGLLFGNGTSPVGITAAGTTGQYLQATTGSAPSWGTLASDSVSSISFGTTGLTPGSPTAGTVVVGGTLVVASGGTGAGTLTGLVKGAGTSAFVAATAGTDYVSPTVVTNFTAKQTFSGGTATLASAIVNAAEPSTVSATVATGTINYDVCTQSVLYYVSNASANWTENLRCSSGTTLNSVMNVGDTVTVVHMVTQGASPFYNNVVTVDGGAITPKWQGGTAPVAGNASGVDAYTYAVVKTAPATFTVFEAQTQFK